MRNARGERQRIMQADQILFLHPAQAIPHGNAIEVGTDVLPDVVLEVDNTTDVRRGKLRLYESWGFPEVWVEVPDEPASSRPPSLRPGLTIHAMQRGRQRPAEASRAFPGWTTEEIHRALNEPELSEETAAVLKRVGRALGAAEGTGPHGDPFLRSERREIHAAGWAEGMQRAVRRRCVRVRCWCSNREAWRCPPPCPSGWRSWRESPSIWSTRRWRVGTRRTSCTGCSLVDSGGCQGAVPVTCGSVWLELRSVAECGTSRFGEVRSHHDEAHHRREVRKELFGTLERVAVYGERIVLDRSGKSVAAIVPMEDLELLRRIEDMLDNEAATEAREEPCRVPWSTLKTELNL